MRRANIASASAPSAIRGETDIVLCSIKIKDGTEGAALSRFSDDVWDLGPAIFHLTARDGARKVDFTGITCPVERLTAKEYIFAWLNERLPDSAERLRPLQARASLGTLRQFMAFVRNREGRFEPALIDQDLLDAYLAFQNNRSVLPSRVAGCLRPAIQLHRLARFLTYGGLSFVPWNGRPVFKVAGCGGRPSENITPRIPEPVIGALLRWSLRYVEFFSTDIFAARAELDGLKAAYDTGIRDAGRPSVEARVLRWIGGRRSTNRGIPVWSQPERMGGICAAIARDRRQDGHVLNMQLIALQCGVHPISLVQNRAAYGLLLDGLRKLGAELGGMDTPIMTPPESGDPWRPRFDSYTLAHEERQLQTAAYILCA